MRFIASYRIEVTHKPRHIIFGGIGVNDNFRGLFSGHNAYDTKYCIIDSQEYPNIYLNGKVAIYIHGSDAGWDGHTNIIEVPKNLIKNSDHRIIQILITNIKNFLTYVIGSTVFANIIYERNSGYSLLKEIQFWIK